MNYDMEEKRRHQCCASIWSDYHEHRCTNNASVERDGKWYCRVHDPVGIAERNKTKEDKWRAEYDERDKKNKEAKRRTDAMIHFCEGISTEYMETNRATGETGQNNERRNMRLFEQVEVPESNIRERVVDGGHIDKFIPVLIDTGEHFTDRDAFISRATKGNGDNPYSGRSFVLLGEAGGEIIHVRETVQYTIDIPNPKPAKTRKAKAPTTLTDPRD